MILVLTAGFGDGHNTAAASMAEALRKLCPDEDIQVSDLVSEVQPLVACAINGFYQTLITYFPAVWRFIYKRLEDSNIEPQNLLLLGPVLNRLRHKIETLRPRLIISTYPLYASLLKGLQEGGMEVPPLVTIITDSISVNPVWTKSPSDLYCVADLETLEILVNKLGVSRQKVRVTGFPVSLKFVEPLPPDPQPAEGRRILYLPSTPGKHVQATLDALKPLLAKGMHLTLPVGKHGPRLYQILRQWTDLNPGANVDIIGWTSRIPEFLRTHDVVICKAGGAIMHEVLAAKIPAVIDYVVPGQEEGNAQMVTSCNGGVCTHTPVETADQVSKILENGCAKGSEMRTDMARFSVPDAALRAAKESLALLESN